VRRLGDAPSGDESESKVRTFCSRAISESIELRIVSRVMPRSILIPARGLHWALMTLPGLVYHADWSKSARKRWRAMAILSDGRYTASEPVRVGDLKQLLESLRSQSGSTGTVFAGFDFPIGVPAHYAEQAKISNFRKFLSELSADDEFFQVCDTPKELKISRPFYPNRSVRGCTHKHLLNAHRALDMASLLRLCEVGGDGRRQACCLFWTLGANAVGKAAITGWKEVLNPALKRDSVRIWPFDGAVKDLLKTGNTVIAETYPAECYGWFPGNPLTSKTDIESRKSFGKNLLLWANESQVGVDSNLQGALEDGFATGGDDAFDAVVGLFGMLQVCLAQRDSGDPEDAEIRDIEGWILGRK